MLFARGTSASSAIFGDGGAKSGGGSLPLGIGYGLTSLRICSRARGIKVAMKDGNHETSKNSGDFAGLSALKDQLSRGDKGAFAGLSALSKQMSEKKTTQNHGPLQHLDQRKQPSMDYESKGPVSLLISNLPKEVTKAEYEVLMQQIPEISNWTFLKHKAGICRGYGFCELRNGADVAGVIEKLKSQNLGGKFLEATVATGRKERELDSDEEDDEKRSSVADNVEGKPQGKTIRDITKLKSRTRAEPITQPARSSTKWSDRGGSEKQATLTLKLKNETRTTTRNVQQQSRNIRSTDRGSLVKSRDESAVQLPRAQQGVSSVNNPDQDGRLSGQKVLDALERFASLGRARQKSGRGPPARTVIDSKEKVEDSNEEQLLEFRRDWAERIQSLEVSIEQLKRS